MKHLICSTADEEFMVEHVQGFLESRMGFAVCEHHRDFMPGSHIAVNIQNAIQKSRRIVAIISRFVLH